MKLDATKNIAAAFVLATTVSVNCYANIIDLTANASGRLNGMVGAGLASVEGAAASVVNPAGIVATRRLDGDVSLQPGLISMSAPGVNGPGTSASTSTFLLLPFAGVNYRLSDMFVGGFSLYMPAGAGVIYPDVNHGIPSVEPKDSGSSLYDIEFGPSVGMDLPTPFPVRLGVGWRISSVFFKAVSYAPETLATASPVYNEASLSGLDFSGFRFGLQMNPTRALKFGATYRTLVEADLDGTVTSQVMGQSATTEADATSKIKYVDKIAAGVTYEFIENTLNASLDYELVFYSRSEDIQVVTSAGTASAPQRFHNNNLIKLGGEYMLKPELPLRAGFALIDYYRDTTYLNYTSVDAPSLTYVFALGTGFRVSDKFVANFAYNFYYQNGTVSGSAANAGQYKNIINTATLGFEYKL